MHILFFLSGLGTGGAERQVFLLGGELVKRGHEVTVCAILPGGRFAAELERKGSVNLLTLFPDSKAGKVGFWHLVNSILRLRKTVTEISPDLVYSLLDVGNLVAALGLSGKEIPLIWGVRSERPQETTWKIKLIRLSMGRLASHPVAVISNSQKGLADARADWPRLPGKEAVIPNGIEVPENRTADRGRLRAEWGFSDEAWVVGNVARAVPEKGHRMLIDAVARMRRSSPGTSLVCVTTGDRVMDVCEYGKRILGENFLCIDDGRPGSECLPGFDSFCLPSLWGEGFSNALAEAMAVGLPCVATDVGDSRDLVGDAGLVVPANDTEALAEALGQLRSGPDADRLGERGKYRIMQEFPIGKMVGRHEAFFTGMLKSSRQGS